MSLTLKEGVELVHAGRNAQINSLLAKVNDNAAEHRRVHLGKGAYKLCDLL